MDDLRPGLRAMTARLDWSLVSLAIYLATPIVWWRLTGDHAGPYRVTTGLASAAILGGGVIAFWRSRTPWQRALCLQVALILAPSTAAIVARVFWSDSLTWIHGRPIAPLTLAGLYVAFGAPWLGLMFAPALIAVPVQWARAWAAPRPPTRAAPDAPAPAAWATGLLWATATLAGLTAPALLASFGSGAAPFAWLAFPVWLGVLQWLVLRRHFPDAAGWIIATIVGGLLGTLAGAAHTVQDLYIGLRGELDPLLTWSTFGAVLGLAQWLVLRRWVRHAHVWVLVNLLAWMAAEAWLQALLAATATGLTLVWLLRRPQPHRPPATLTASPNGSRL